MPEGGTGGRLLEPPTKPPGETGMGANGNCCMAGRQLKLFYG